MFRHFPHVFPSVEVLYLSCLKNKITEPTVHLSSKEEAKISRHLRVTLWPKLQHIHFHRNPAKPTLVEYSLCPNLTNTTCIRAHTMRAEQDEEG